MTKALSQMPP